MNTATTNRRTRTEPKTAAIAFFLLLSITGILDLLVPGCVSPSPIPMSQEVTDGLFRILQLSESSQDYVRLARENLKGEQLEKARRQYLTLKAAGNAYIKLVKLGLISDTEPAFDDKANDVAQAYASFVEVVAPNKALLASGDAVAGILTGLMQSAIQLWQAKRQQREELIERINAELDKSQWPQWEDIP